MQFWDYLAGYTGLTIEQLLHGADGPLVVAQCDAVGNFSFSTWAVPGKAKPSSADVAAALAAAPSAAELLAYANARQWTAATSGWPVTVDGGSHVLATDVDSLSLMGGKVSRLSRPDAPATVNWQMQGGEYCTFAAADFITAATAAADMVQRTFDKMMAIEPQITSGTITTYVEIDAVNWAA